ncbi:MAG: polysaccharide biosynthesis tyrosine autokinase [Bacteroidia bacterium]
MSLQPMPEQETELPQGGFDYTRFIKTLIKYWYVFVIGLAVALSVAKWYHWYAIPKYSASVTLLIKDEKDANLSAEKLLQDFEDDAPKHNMSNEIEMLQSRSIMEQVVTELPLSITYLSRKNLKKSDLYKRTPIIVTADSLLNSAYRSTLRINIIDSLLFELGFDGDDGKNITYFFGQKIDTKIGVLKVNKAPLFDSPQFKKERLTDREFLVRFTSIESLIAKYSNAIAVDKVNKESTILKLSLTDVVADRAEDVLNKTCEVYLRNDINHKNKVASNTLSFIDDQLSVTSTDLKNIENNIERFKSSSRISTDISTEANLYLTNAHDADVRMAQVRYKYNVADYVEKFIKGNNNLDDMSLSVSGIDEPQLNKLIDELRILEAKKSQYTLAAKADNPLMVSLNYQLDRTRESIVNNITAIKKNLAMLIADSQGSIDKYETQLRAVPRTERQLLGLKRQFDIKEQMYLFLLQKRAETSIALASTVSDSHVVDAAMADDKPISPVKSKIYTIALLMSVVLPLLFFYLKTSMNTTIGDKNVLTSLTNISLLGVVKNNTENTNALIVTDSPKSANTECFRALRTNLTYVGDSNKKTILVTSSIKGEGKTYIAINLANVEAMAGKKTVLLMCDLRKQPNTAALKIDATKGLSNYLQGKATLANSTQQCAQMPNLDIVAPGEFSANSSELLLSTTMTGLIHTLRNTYDIVIIDSPPIGIVSDTLTLATYADATLYVVRENVTERKHIAFLNQLKTEQKLRNIALVFNGTAEIQSLYGFDADENNALNNTGIMGKVREVLSKVKALKNNG